MQNWKNSLKVYSDKRIITILLLGFSSGLPLLLIASTLSLWLDEVGVGLSAIGMFALVKGPYSFKFLISPIIDRISLPIFCSILGRRRGWIFFTQIMLMLFIIAMAFSNPAQTPQITAICAVMVAFFSASQDIAIDAYRIELLRKDEQGAGAGAVVLGYRLGMLAAGAGALFMAETISWDKVYLFMASLVSVGMIAVMFSRRIGADKSTKELYSPEDYELINKMFPKDDERMKRLYAFIYKAVICPFKDFMKNPGWIFILLFIMLYKLSDAYMGPMVMPFYKDMGFSKFEIAYVGKVYGMAATIVGGIIGGAMVMRYGIMRSLIICGILHGITNFAFAWLATYGHSVPALTFIISFENITGGMGTSAFVAYMSSLCNVAYTATQYALLSSFMSFARDVLSTTSGQLAEHVGWMNFFLIAGFMAFPGLILLAWMNKHYPQNEEGK